MNLDDKKTKKVWLPASSKMMDTVKPYVMQVYKEKRLAWIIGIGLIMLVVVALKWWDLSSLDEGVTVGLLVSSLWAVEVTIGLMATVWFYLMVHRPYRLMMKGLLQYQVGLVTNKTVVSKWFKGKNYLEIDFGHGESVQKSVGLVLYNEVQEGDQLIQVSLIGRDSVYELVPVNRVGQGCIEIDE